MAYQGEYFVERYGARGRAHGAGAAMLDMGVPVGAGTDATRVAAYNPWVSLSWLVTGQTIGGTTIYPAANRLDRETALRLWTEANTWLSTEAGKGQIKAGQLADLAALSDDYFSVSGETIQHITSVLTLLAVLGALIAVPLLWRWKLQAGADLDLTPSVHWAEPVLSRNIEADRGPLLVTVEYKIRPEERALFLDTIAQLADERRRDGAFDWGIFEDLAHEGRFVETFMLDSWIEHLRQHEGVTHADRGLQERVNRFQVDGAPKVDHLIAAPRS
jgi:hypothetical protein